MSTENKFDSTYSVLEAIYNKLKSGSGLDVDFGSIYSQEMIDSVAQQLNDDIAYTKSKEKPHTNDVSNFYKNDTKLVYAPQYFSDGTLFRGSVMIGVYSGCTELRYVPMIDTSSVANMSDMFSNCTSLTSIPQLDTSKVTKMASMFYGCESLTSIPQLDTSNVTDMVSMFYNCSQLKTIPQLDTSKVTKMHSMFDRCESLTSIPQLDTSNVTDMYGMFDGCKSLTSIPQLDTSNVININYMLDGCKSLTSIPYMDCSKVENGSLIVNYDLPNVTYVGGFKDYGKMFNYSSPNYTGCFLSLWYLPNITHESLMNVINNLYDLNLNGSAGGLRIGTTNLSKLTPDEIAIATNKGWTVS